MTELRTAFAAEHADLEALAPIVGWAFGDDANGALAWLKGAGSERVRIAREGARVVGGLVEVPMGQWFGGESVRTLGLAGVAVAPEERGRGLALALLQQTLRSARERGFALSTLYPSTFGLYRKAGYELAGGHCRFTLQLRRLERRKRGALEVQPLGAEHTAEVERLYAAVARRRAGYLDRNDYIWQRVRNPHHEAARAYGVSDRDGLSGYIYVKPVKGMPIQFVVSDFITRTSDALQSLLVFLADHLTTAESASWKGGLADARLFGLPDRVVSVTLEDYWMVRLVDVRAALLTRGYPALDAAVELVVEDALLPENAGRYALVVEQGRARLAPSASESALPRARLSGGGLAALYSGFASAHELRLAGKLEADERAEQMLQAIFAGPAPGLPDFF